MSTLGCQEKENPIFVNSKREAKKRKARYQGALEILVHEKALKRVKYQVLLTKNNDSTNFTE